MKKGRKSKYPSQTFKSRKIQKNSNRTHFTVKGKLVKAKCFLDFDCQCSLNCRSKIEANVRKTIFEQFWAFQTYESQVNFIAASVTQQSIKRKRTKASNIRQFTRTYHLNKVCVCRNMFIKTLQISTKTVDTALKKFNTGNIKDEKGTYARDETGNSAVKIINRLPDEIKGGVVRHSESFPTYVSHYCRGETEARYLNSDLTLTKMFTLYLEDQNPKVSFSTYKRLFYDNFNLRIKPPVKDTCNTCDKFNAKMKSYQDDAELFRNNQMLQNQHLENAEKARKAMKSDLARSAENINIETLTYDMEKVLSLPKLPTNIVYYKRQLSVFNEGIYQGSNAQSYFFIWKEGITGRGAQEVGSCLQTMIENYVSPDTEEIILWSDSCGGQNRNIKIVLFLKTLFEGGNSLAPIYFKYLVPGHSYLPNDSNFRKIETAIKRQIRIYTLGEFKDIVAGCSKNPKFIVNEMTKQNFFSTEELEKGITNRKKDVRREKVSWLNARVIKIEKEKPFSIFFKSTHDEEGAYQEINIKKKS